MAKTVKPREKVKTLTPEAKEQKLVGLAYDQVESMLENGTAPASVLTYFLKIGSTREVLEREIIDRQLKLLEAKAENLANGSAEKQAYMDCIAAIKEYGYRAS